MDDPFAMSDLKDALPDAPRRSPERSPEPKSTPVVTQLDGLEWRIANALLSTQLCLSEAYAIRGSAREAEYFTMQAEELARILGSQTMVSRALLLHSEVRLALGQSDEALRMLTEAMELIDGLGNLDIVDLNRALGDQLVRQANEGDAQAKFDTAMDVLSKMESSCAVINKSIAPGRKPDGEEFFAPLQQGKILRQLGQSSCLILIDTLTFGMQYGYLGMSLERSTKSF